MSSACPIACNVTILRTNYLTIKIVGDSEPASKDGHMLSWTIFKTLKGETILSYIVIEKLKLYTQRTQ